MTVRLTGNKVVYQEFAEFVEYEDDSMVINDKSVPRVFWKISVSGTEEPKPYESKEQASGQSALNFRVGKSFRAFVGEVIRETDPNFLP